MAAPRCQREMDRQRRPRPPRQRQASDPRVSWTDCRADLMAAIQGGAPRCRAPASTKPVDPFPGSVERQLLGHDPPAAAGGSDRADRDRLRGGEITGGFLPSVPRLPTRMRSTVRSISPDSGGGVQISFDETRRRESGPDGRPEDPGVVAGCGAGRQSGGARGIDGPSEPATRGGGRSPRCPAQLGGTRSQCGRPVEGARRIEAAGPASRPT